MFVHLTFFGCSGLTSVICLANDVPNTSIVAFYDAPISSATLKVPAASLQAYKTTTPWSLFGKILDLEGNTEGETSDAKEINVDAMSLLITQSEGMVAVSGANDGDVVTAYGTDGKQLATTKAIGKEALLNLSDLQGKVAIINVGGKSAKVMVN